MNLLSMPAILLFAGWLAIIALLRIGHVRWPLDNAIKGFLLCAIIGLPTIGLFVALLPNPAPTDWKAWVMGLGVGFTLYLTLLSFNKAPKFLQVIAAFGIVFLGSAASNIALGLVVFSHPAAR